MILASLQAQTFINWFNHQSINQPFHTTVMNYVLRPFKGNINIGYPTELKIYLQETKKIDKETDKLDISVLNAKDIIDQFISLANKHGWGRIAFMVGTDIGSKNIFRVVEQIHLAEI